MNAFPENPFVTSRRNEVAVPTVVAIDDVFALDHTRGEETVIVTTKFTVVPIRSVAVKVSMYVPASTVVPTRMKAYVVPVTVEVSKVIPALLGDKA